MAAVSTSAPAAAPSATSTAVAGFVGKEEPEVTTVCGRLTTKNQEDSYIGGCKDGESGEAEFCFPNGLALGKDKALYVSDSDNRRIRKVDLKTGRVITFAGGGGTGYLESRAYPFGDLQGEHARFGEVRGIALDSKDNLYVADMFHYRIRKITPEAEVSTFAGQAKSKPAEQPPGTAAPAPAPAAGAAAAAGGATNTTAQPPAPDPNEQYADGPATGGAKFNRPSAVAIDKQNNVFVCDFSNNRIRKVSPDGQVSTYAGSGEKGYKDGPAKEAAFNWPNHICIDKNGNIYVAEAENYCIRKVSANGQVSTYAGCRERGFHDGPADKAKFDGPNAVACDNDGFLYVTEDENHRIRVISPNGVVRTLAGNGDRGEMNGPTALASSFAMPTGLIIDPDSGHMYVCDYGNHLIRKIHHRALTALKASMLKETDGRFPPMPQIDEEDDKEEADPVSTNSAPSQSGAKEGEEGAPGDASAAAGGKKKEKKKSKSKKREKSEMSEEGKMNGDAKAEESANGSGSGAGRKASASANSASADGSKKEGDAADDAKKDEDADNKSCRMCQNKNGCSVM